MIDDIAIWDRALTTSEMSLLNANPLSSFLTSFSANVCPGGQTTPAPCSQTLTLNYNVNTSTTFATNPTVVTQGAPSLDFTLSSGSTCTGAITAPATCTVTVQFAPRAPGSRIGAVQLSDSFGNLLATTFVQGIGQGPAIAFGPGVQTTMGTGLITPVGVAVDGAGDVFIADTGNSKVVEVPAGGGAQITLGSGLSQSTGVAVDGAGNVFIADYGNSRAVEVQRSQPPTLIFATTVDGLTSTDSPQSVTVQNIGNQPLDAFFPGLGIGGDFTEVSGSGVLPECSVNFSQTVALTPGASCNLSVSFTPQTPNTGLLSENAEFVDNALNNASATQNVALEGNALPLMSQTISFPTPAPGSAIAGSTFTVAAQSTSGLTVTLSVDSGSTSVCSLGSPTVTGPVISVSVIMLIGTGTCTIDANQAGGAGYSAAAQQHTSSTAVLAQVSQTITFTTAAPGSATYNTTFPVAAKSTSGLTVTLSVDSGSTSVCSLGTSSVSGGVTSATVTMTSGSGTCTIFALQPGNTTYSAAVPLGTSAAAQTASQTISLTQPAPSTVAAQSTSGLTVTLSVDHASTEVCSLGVPGVSGGVTTATVTTMIASGTCLIDANQSGNGNYSAATQQQTAVTAAILGTSLTVTNTNDSGYGSLRDAIARAASGDTITFRLSYPATITLGSTLTISTNLTISGPGASNVAISGGNAVQVFSIGGRITVNISGVTIENGNASSDYGGGITNSGTLTLTNSTVSGNSATYYGGGIYNNGTATLTNDTVSGNSAPYYYGGGITNSGTLTLTK